MTDKRFRRTKEEVEIIGEYAALLAEQHQPVTVRQIFYQLVSKGIVNKTEEEYGGTVVRLLRDLRLSGRISWDWIADSTRWMRKPITYSSVEAALRRTASLYRRSVWDEQDTYVEVWLEKDALVGTILEVTAEYDVPLMVNKGYASLSFLHLAAEAIEAQGKPAYIYYLGDSDPSGNDIARNTEARLRQFAPKADLHFVRVAVLPWQIKLWNLPVRPTKASDPRAQKAQGQDSVEVDAIDPMQLRALVRDSIEQHIDQHVLKQIQVVEDSEREWLERLVADIQRV